jgi:hypothetical protein
MGDEQMPAVWTVRTQKPARRAPGRGAAVIWVRPVAVGLGKWVLWRWPPSLRVRRWRGALGVSAALAGALGAITAVGRFLFPSWVYFLAWMELWVAALSVAGSMALLAVWPAPRIRRRRRLPLTLMHARPHTWQVLLPPRDEGPIGGAADGAASRRCSQPLDCHEEE